jgi:histidinol phosphatase-like PHP family hydrolase
MCHPVEKVFETIDLIPIDDMYKVFKKARELGVGIELNGGDMLHYNQAKDTILKPFKIAKDCKCKFYIGSDSHHPERFRPLTENFTKVIDDLGLEESDRFFIK